MTNQMGKDGAGRRGLEIDVAKYQAMIDDPKISEGEKRQFVEALWQILVTFVDLGFDLHPATVACGKLGPNGIENCPEPKNMLYSEDIFTGKFEDVASTAEELSGEESEHES